MRGRLMVALLAAVVGAVTGCSGSSTGSSGSSTGTAGDNASRPAGRPSAPGGQPGAAAKPSEGCGRTAPEPGKITMSSGRTYLLALPDAYLPDRPVPVVVNLHGLGSNAVEQALYSRLPALGPVEGFIVVTPESAPGRRGWRLPRMRNGSADIEFVGELLDHVERRMCVDQRREFAAGMSNGAGLSAAMVCGLPGRLAAIGAVAGINLAVPCTNTRPTTIIAFHGTADEIVPYQGGAPFGDWSEVPAWMRPSGERIDLPAVETIVAGWARNFGCVPGNDVSGGEVRLRRYAGCRDGAVVELHTVAGGGHTWPGSISVGGLGKTTKLIDATELMLAAFAGHPAAR